MQTTGTDTSSAATDETNLLIASDKVEGTAVYNTQGKRLGTVENLMVDKLRGKVDYAVMSFGGFLGIGDSYHPLPWKLLTYDTNLGGYVVNVTKDQLQGAPSYSATEDADWANPDYGRRIYDYYGMGLGGPV